MDDVIDPLEVADPEPSAKGRVWFWAVGLAAVLGFGSIAAFWQSGSREREDTHDDTTTTSQVRQREAPIDEVVDRDPARTVDDSAEIDQSEADQSPIDFGSAAEATSRLDSYQFTMRQQTRSLEIHVEVVQVGESAVIETNFGSSRTESIFSGGKLYESSDGVWYLKPAPMRSLKTVSLPDLTASIASLPSVEIERSAESVMFELRCGTADRDSLADELRSFCDDRVAVVAHVALDTGLLTLVEGTGDLEIYPDVFEEGSLELRMAAVSWYGSIDPPEEADLSGAECVGEALGVTDYFEMAELLERTTTEENRRLFTRCGFDVFPAGVDYLDAD